MTPIIKQSGPILVVEDDQDTRLAIRWILEDEGLIVEEAADGQAALDSAERRRPSLLVLDIGLVGMDGEEVAERLRARCGQELPILVISAGGRSAEVARRLGADYLDKPFELDDLVERVLDVLAVPS